MSWIGRVLASCAVGLAALAAPAGATFGEVGRIDVPNGLNSVALSASGDAVYADESGDSGGGIQHFTPTGTQTAQWTVAGTPFGLAVESTGTLLVANAPANAVYRYSSAGEELGHFGTDGSGDGQMHNPLDVAIGPNGDIYVADNGNNRVERFSASGTYVSQIANTALPAAFDGFPHTSHLSVDAAGNVYVSDGGNKSIRKFDPSGALVATFGTTGEGTLATAGGTGVDPAGNLYVADMGNSRIAVFKPDGTFAASIGKGILGSPVDVAVDPSGNVYVADPGPEGIIKLANDVTAPKITRGGAAKQSMKAGSVKVTVASDEAAKLAASGVRLAAAKGSVAAGNTTTLALKISAAAKKAVRKGKKVAVTVTVKATDAGGNVATATRKITLKR